MTRFLHVANGTCTTRIIEAAGIPGARSIWADPLYEGPVPGGLGDEELIEVRRAYLSGGSDEPVDAVNDLRRWRQVIADHDAYDELVLWYEHDLFDQLNLIQLLPWIRDTVPAATRVSLISVGSFPGRPQFKGLGELSPGELASLFEARRPVSDAEYDLAARAWRAFREPAPGAFANLRGADTGALPFLAAAIDRFLQEYPATGDGLSRTERRLLRLAEPASIALREAFPRMHDGEQVYYVTDLSVGALATTLSQTSPPLVAIAGSGDPWSLGRTMALTDAGRDVLAGRRDRVACGMDRWLGGVHLKTGGAMWRWDESQQRLTRS